MVQLESLDMRVMESPPLPMRLPMAGTCEHGQPWSNWACAGMADHHILSIKSAVRVPVWTCRATGMACKQASKQASKDSGRFQGLIISKLQCTYDKASLYGHFEVVEACHAWAKGWRAPEDVIVHIPGKVGL